MGMFTTSPKFLGKEPPRLAAYDHIAVTPNNSVDLPNGICKGVVCSGAGNIAGVDPSGATILLTGVPANTVLDHAFSRINATSTTATGIAALY